MLLAVAGTAAGCSAAPADPAAPAPTPTPTASSTGPSSSSSASPLATSTPEATATPSATRPPVPDPAKIDANELGQIPVMMYHQLIDTPGEYDMTPAAFRRQLRRLLSSGYRPVDAADFVAGRIDIPAGRTPVVLTFDDSTSGQFRLLRNGTIDPTCSAGILIAECARVPGAQAKATFYINRAPFGLATTAEQQRGLQALLGAGLSLGNHTLDHANLATLSDAGVAQEFVELQRLVAKLAPEAPLRTMALPFGVEPRNRALATHGSWHGTRYAFDLTLLVGANPSPSPYASAFEPSAVPRIRGTSWHGGTTPLTGRYWLDHLDAHPEQRFVSAGNPGHVTVPKALKPKVAEAFRDRLITY